MESYMNTDTETNAISNIRIVVADDHPIVRKGIRDELDQVIGIDVVGEAEDGDAAISLCSTIHPDVLVLDINMPGTKASSVIRSVRAQDPPVQVLVLSAFGDLEYILAMLKAGARGYLLKDENPSEIIRGVFAVAKGETRLSQAIASSLVMATVRDERDRVLADLTARELEVLCLIARGKDNSHISDDLSISMGTVKNHVSNIYSKLDVNSRAEAVAWAWEHGIVD